MKKIILLPILLLIIGLIPANAETQIIVDPLANPYSDTFTLYGETGHTLSTIKNCLGVSSCYVQDNYESKQCHYLYWCYAILPWDSTNINDAILKECVDITESDKTLEIKDFVPPKGILYYVSTFVTKVKYTYNDNLGDWNTPVATIPQSCGGKQLIHAQDIRAICPSGQLLAIKRDSNGVITEGSFGCYPAKRRCLDTMSTGLCTNPYDLYVLDVDGDGNFAEHYNLAAAYCRDGDHDGTCDYKISWDCPDVCKGVAYNANGELYCSLSGSNGICDIWDYAVLASCEDDELSPHSGICDDIDTGVCNTEFIPVCVASTNGETVGGTTYPNDCYAEAKGISECLTSTPTIGCYVSGQCAIVDPQCYTSVDCPDLDVCGGGQVLDKLCIDYMCIYDGACTTSECQTDDDCDYLENICVGISATCNVGAGVCSVSGSCIQQPVSSQFNLWQLIQNVFSALFNFIKSLFGA